MYQLLHRLGKYPIEESECVGSAIERRDRMQMNRRSIVSLVLSTGATGIAAPTFAFSQAPPASDTPAGTLKVTIPNHVAVDIVATPDDVWRAIREEYGEAKKFSAFDKVAPLDDPAAYFGGYRMTVEKEDRKSTRLNSSH